MFAQKKAALVKTQAAAAMKQSAESPYATIANGKADVEGGVINVAARRAGVVKAVYVEEGQKVRKNQVLAQQEDDDARLALNSAMAQVAQAKAQVALIEVQKATAQRELARLQPLLAKNYVAHQQIDNARDAVRQADANLGSQRAAIQTAEAAGCVGAIQCRPERDPRACRRYDRTPLRQSRRSALLDPQRLQHVRPRARHRSQLVRAEIVESALPLVAVGQEVELVPEADSTKLFPGKVIRISAQFGARKLQSDDPNERTGRTRGRGGCVGRLQRRSSSVSACW